MAFRMNTGFLSFKIKAITKEKKEEKKSSSSYVSLTTGVVIKEGDDYFVTIKNLSDSEAKETKYEFTEESYDIYDRTVIYSRKPDKKGLYKAIIKTHNDAKLYFHGIHPLYVPFRPGRKVRGKLVKVNGVKKFNLVEVCNPDSYVSY